MLEQGTFNNTYIGGYRITQELAFGPGSRVFLGETGSLSEREPVVIKWFHTRHLGSARARQEFLREAARLRRLRHPVLLSVLSAGLYTDTPYLVMPYMGQGSLYDRLQQPSGRAWARPQALTLVRRLGQGIAHAHRQNLVHGNIKTRNVLFDEQDDVVLADFALMSLTLHSSNPSAAGGTASLADERLLSPADDVYALACIAYELLTGQQPFPYTGTRPLSSDNAQPIALSWFDNTVAPYIEEAILKALAQQPADRYSSINAFLRALDPPTAIIPSITPAQKSLEQVPTAPMGRVTRKLPPQMTMDDDDELFSAYEAPTKEIPLSSQRGAVKKVPRRQSSRRQWPLFMLAAALCLVIFGLIGTQLRLHLPASTTHVQVASPLAIVTPDQDPLRTAMLTGTARAFSPSPLPSATWTVTPRAASTPYLRPTPTPVKRSHHASLSSPPRDGLTAVPASLIPQACAHELEWYHCEITLTLGEDAGGAQSWEGSSTDIAVIISPQHGILAPGEHVQVVLQITSHCPADGSLLFSSADSSATVGWHC